MVPYFIVAIPLMLYNYARFGSITEFGAKYQLTCVDASDISERYKDILKGLYDYYLTIPKISKEFPYIKNSYSMKGHTQNYYNGGIASGIIFLNMTIVICLKGIKYYKMVKDRLLKSFIIILPITGIILSIIVIVAGGTLQRYAVDFLWMFSTLAMILWMLAYQNAKDKRKIIILLSILIICSIIINIFGTYFNSEYNYFEKLTNIKY